jgi:hypothetical protein
MMVHWWMLVCSGPNQASQEPIHTCLSFTKSFERKISSSFFKHPFLRETEKLGFVVGLALVGKDIVF